ncbi:MAG: glycine cleavage system protein H [Phycisphaerae bacterium]|nr:glycine cleavage system protein H [Phycisphaerae bacterium]|tara:strand:+ start:365 stop:745 length:381 start_codon:yes stop_codon:yes gene_type:complete
MASPTDCLYTDSHEWFRKEGDVVTIGITQFATNELTDITYVEMKPAGTAIKVGDALGEVESVKTSSDVYSAFGGEVVEVNEAASSDPSLLNQDPYGAGWLIKLRCDGDAGTDLLEPSAYDSKYPLD